MLHKYLIVHIDIILYKLRSPCTYCVTISMKMQNYKTSEYKSYVGFLCAPCAPSGMEPMTKRKVAELY